MKLNPTAFALALGLVVSISTFAFAIISYYTGWAADAIALAGTLYLGYEATWMGAFIGAVWGFGDGFIGGFILALIYNKIAR